MDWADMTDEEAAELFRWARGGGFSPARRYYVTERDVSDETSVWPKLLVGVAAVVAGYLVGSWWKSRRTLKQVPSTHLQHDVLGAAFPEVLGDAIV